MNRADIALLNQSIQNMGQDFFRNRALAQQADQADQERQLREQMLQEQIASRQQMSSDTAQARQQQYKAYQEHWNKMEQSAQLHAATQEILDAGKRMQTSMGTIGEQVRGGALTQADANSYFKSAIDGMPDDMRQKMLTDPSFAAAYSGRLDWSKVGMTQPKDIKPQPFNVGDATGLYNPNSGSFQFTPRGPMDKIVTPVLDPRTSKPTGASRTQYTRPGGSGPGSISPTDFQKWQAAQPAQLQAPQPAASPFAPPADEDEDQ